MLQSKVNNKSKLISIPIHRTTSDALEYFFLAIASIGIHFTGLFSLSPRQW